MIFSMTGYGSSIQSSKNYQVNFELKSLNSKYLEITLKLPKVYIKYEHEARSLLSKKLQRGKVVALMTVTVLGEGKHFLNINKNLAKSYLNELNELREVLKIKGEIDLPFIVGLPEVIPTEMETEDQEEWELIQAALHEASDRLIESRKEEGKALKKDLMDRKIAIAALLEKVKALAPQRLENVRSRLDKALEEIRHKVVEFDTNRYEQELIFYMEKIDINEELVRLAQHLTYFEEMLTSGKGKGKKLQFLAQEIGREINTIGSKANDALIQRTVVEMKDELEKIKEQVLNIV